jgi:hypothetical protein
MATYSAPRTVRAVLTGGGVADTVTLTGPDPASRIGFVVVSNLSDDPISFTYDCNGRLPSAATGPGDRPLAGYGTFTLPPDVKERYRIDPGPGSITVSIICPNAGLCEVEI